MFSPLSGYLSALSSAYQAKGGHGPLFREAEAAELEAAQVVRVIPSAKGAITAARDALVESTVTAVAAATLVDALADFGARVRAAPGRGVSHRG